MNNAGIDYGLGMTNIDHETGIRYGVIHQNEVLQTWADSSEGQYPDIPFTCPECEGELIKIADGLSRELPDNGGVEVTGDTYYCEKCDKDYNQFDSDIEYQEIDISPECFTYDGDGYQCQQPADDPDIFVLKSPYFTYCKFCSPCAPGAGYLMDYYKTKKSNNTLNDTMAEILLPLYIEKYPNEYKQNAENSGYIKAYCFDASWFEDGKAPYPVFSVETGELISCG